MDPPGIESQQTLQRLDREQGEGAVQIRHPRPVEAAHPEDVVAHRAVRRRGHQDDFIADLQFELTCHLGANHQFAGCRGGGSPFPQRLHKAADPGLAGGVDAHQHARRGGLARAHQARPIDSRRGRHHLGVPDCRPHHGFEVGAGTAPESLVEAAVRPVPGGVDLYLSCHQAGAVVNQLHLESVGEADHEDDGKVACCQAQRRDEGASRVAPQIAPADQPPGRKSHGRSPPAPERPQ